METNTSLVGAYRAVHLHAESSVYVNLTAIVRPRNPEHDNALRLDHSFEYFLIHKVRVFNHIVGNALDNFPYCLVKLLLARIFRDKLIHELLNVVLCKFFHI